ncbi:MAG: multidrug efflux protein [Coxiella sp. (in: Bacteria)]|nr:MAG: multidrug efflux protein [Coxiella sp. (in: g-proteobacteria)]
MATFTDIFIKRPVLAVVVSALILLFGIRSFSDMAVRQYPKMDNTTITITTSYPGASGDLVQGFITSPLEKQISTANGIDYMTSQSTDGTSQIQAFIKLNYDPEKAFVDIMSKVQQVKGDLPPASQEPVIIKSTGSQTGMLYVAFSSKTLSSQQITDYISRVIQPQIESIQGVAEVQILGGSVFAMRAWLNPQKMASLGVSMTDVQDALRSNNFLSAAGNTKGKYIQVAITAETEAKTPEAFQQLIVKRGDDGEIIRLKDVARVELGKEDYDTSVYFNNTRGVFISVSPTPEANPLSMITQVRNLMPKIYKQMPPGLSGKIVYDATKFISASIKEVIETIFEAVIIVIIVIFAFLGSFRTVTIPVVTVPLSLVGIFTFMNMMGYSINLLTLLAMVLAIGLVVDDAIVVVENVYRHVEEGMEVFDASIKGARDIATPIISMTITLAAVYVPIGFMGGLTGALFKEFAFTLAGAVVISGIIALTLSPMMCSKLFSPTMAQTRMVRIVDGTFSWLRSRYENILHHVMKGRSVIYGFAFIVLLSCFFMFLFPKQELAPTEDQGVVFFTANTQADANIDYVEHYTAPIPKMFASLPSYSHSFLINVPGQIFGAVILKPWDERTQTQEQAFQISKQKLGTIPGLQTQVMQPPPFPVGGSSLGVQFSLTTTNTFKYLYPYSQRFLDDAMKSGIFLFMFNMVQYDKPEFDIKLNRSMASQMGINMHDVANTLATAYGGNYTNWFSMFNRSYKVIPQVQRMFRSNIYKSMDLYLPTLSGDFIPMSTFAHVTHRTGPQMLTNFAQLTAVGLMGAVTPGHTVGDAVDFVQQEAKRILPHDISYDYMGQTRLFVQEGNALMVAFIFSLLIIYLVLAAQFDSLKDPLVVMTTVPMAICGALLPLNWGLATINIYTQIGLITLIGLITKHGILIVEFANTLIEEKNLSIEEAAIQAAAIRFRPVLMTTFAMIFAMIPLLIAEGAGAASRFDIGLVISMGLGVGTLFTLFILPVMYIMKGRNLLLFLLTVIIVAYCLFTWFFKIL